MLGVPRARILPCPWSPAHRWHGRPRPWSRTRDIEWYSIRISKRSSPHLGHTSFSCLRDLRASDFLLASRFSLLSSFPGTSLAPLLPEEPKGGYLNHNPHPSTSLFFNLNIPWLIPHG